MAKIKVVALVPIQHDQEEIEVGQEFDIDTKQLDQLQAVGAVTVVEVAEKVDDKKADK